MPPTGLPPALQVFPTLRRFPALRPRRQAEVPIGCRGRDAGAIDAHAAQQSILHLYHDLGVLVFAGATPRQTQRIGDVVRQVVAWGGLGGAAARMDGKDGEHGKRRAADGELAKQRREAVLDKVLRPLWQLERQVWAERAEEVLKSGRDGVE